MNTKYSIILLIRVYVPIEIAEYIYKISYNSALKEIYNYHIDNFKNNINNHTIYNEEATLSNNIDDIMLYKYKLLHQIKFCSTKGFLLQIINNITRESKLSNKLRYININDFGIMLHDYEMYQLTHYGIVLTN